MGLCNIIQKNPEACVGSPMLPLLRYATREQRVCYLQYPTPLPVDSSALFCHTAPSCKIQHLLCSCAMRDGSSKEWMGCARMLILLAWLWQSDGELAHGNQA